MTPTSKNSFTKEPKQDRSRASLERLLKASVDLLTSKGYADFTLNEVSKLSKVSIGSIYNRFNGKEDLIRQVQQHQILRMDAETALLINNIRRKDLKLRELVPDIIHGFADFLANNRKILRALMEIAIIDEVVAQTGRKHLSQSLTDFEKLLMECKDEITQPDPERAIHVIFQIIYSSLARHLGLGTVDASLEDGDWKTLVNDLSNISLHYLMGDPQNIQ